MSSNEDNEAVVRACFQAGTDGNLDALDAIISRDYVLHDPSSQQEVRGVEGLKDLVEMYRNGVPGLRVTIEHQFTEGDYVATRFTARGTHEGEIIGLPPTGREITMAGITISRCRDGKIVEEWEVSDVFGLLRQIGRSPRWPRAEAEEPYAGNHVHHAPTNADEDAMSVAYRLLYRVGFTPWEQIATLPVVTERISALFEREEAGRQPPYGRALDLGCGSGIWAVKLAARGWEVTGVDFVPKALRMARERAQEAGVEVRLVEGDVTKLREAGVGSLLLDFGLFHDELTEGRRQLAGNARASAPAERSRRRRSAPLRGRLLPRGGPAVRALPPPGAAPGPGRGATRAAPGGLVAVGAPSRHDSFELAHALPATPLTFDAELAPGILEELFAEVEVERWDAPLLDLPRR